MSQTGEVIFYRKSRPDDPAPLLTNVLQWSKATNAFIISRTREEEHGWEDFQRNLATPIYFPVQEVVDDDWEDLDASEPLSRAARYYQDGKCLTFQITSPQGDRVHSAIAEGIPVSVRCDFIPGDLIISIGDHDLIHFGDDEADLIARAFLSIRFFGYSCSCDKEAYEDLVFKLPVVRKIKAELEEITGPLQECLALNP